MCVAEYARYSDDPWVIVAVVYIYICFDNSDVVLRHGPHLKICIIYFCIVIYFDYAYAFPG